QPVCERPTRLLPRVSGSSALLLVARSDNVATARHAARLAEMTPARGDDEKHAGDGESDSRNDRPCSCHLEQRDLGSGQPDASEENEQEADLGQCSARLRRHQRPIVARRHRVSAPDRRDRECRSPGRTRKCWSSRKDGMWRASSAQARIVRAGVQTVELEEAPMTIVVGLDQYRAQITTEWIDTVTGEIGRARVSPAQRDGVRRFLGRFAGQELEVALEATTGWRFVVEELRAVGAGVHLGEPAQTSALRGNKKRPKTDWADARHLRELLMIERLPESWIPPDHLLDLRSKVRLRHTLVDQRGEWQQRIRAVLYHHGLPNRELHLLGREGRAWLDEVEIRDAAREQITVAVAMSEALDFQIAPLDK